MKKNKVLICILIFFAIFLVVVNLNKNFKNSNNNGINTINKISPQYTSTSTISPYQELLDKIDNQSNNSNFPSSTINIDGKLKKLYAGFYFPNNPETIQNNNISLFNHPNENNISKQIRAGIVLFESFQNKNIIFWESEDILYGIMSNTYFSDINGDNEDEVVLVLGQGVRLVPAIYIYKRSGNKYYLINPNPNSKNFTDRWMAGLDAKLEDIDGDNIKEVVSLNGDSNDPDSYYQRIFKFNGSEYYLFKETHEPAKFN